jgi:DNA-binding CsgD family transcriptional regulator
MPRERRIEALLDQRFEWTARQREVLDLIARGKTNQEVAHTLGISLDGAKWHMREILSKLGVDTREEAAEYWRRRNGWSQRVRRAARHALGLPLIARVAAAGTASLVATAAVIGIVSLRQADDLASGDTGVDPSPPAALGDDALQFRTFAEAFGGGASNPPDTGDDRLRFFALETGASPLIPLGDDVVFVSADASGRPYLYRVESAGLVTREPIDFPGTPGNATPITTAGESLVLAWGRTIYLYGPNGMMQSVDLPAARDAVSGSQDSYIRVLGSSGSRVFAAGANERAVYMVETEPALAVTGRVATAPHLSPPWVLLPAGDDSLFIWSSAAFDGPVPQGGLNLAAGGGRLRLSDGSFEELGRGFGPLPLDALAGWRVVASHESNPLAVVPAGQTTNRPPQLPIAESASGEWWFAQSRGSLQLTGVAGTETFALPVIEVLPDGGKRRGPGAGPITQPLSVTSAAVLGSGDLVFLTESALVGLAPAR